MKQDTKDRGRGCDNAQTLVQSYLDGELSEEQASPLRAHLLECPRCRELCKEETALKRWFRGAAEEAQVTVGLEAQVPEGFASRVARRAFAGDRGLLEPAPAAGPSDPGLREGRLFTFVLVATAVAAVVLIVLSAAIRFQEVLPAGSGMDATESRELGDLLRDLDRENQELEQQREVGAR